jgi:BirA family transcriptional regulator, biotin operon repressor / biotin---[acetyl-CoA-carboxylase] ligase
MTTSRPAGALAIVRLLADGQLRSGEAIAEELGVTRAAVWKALHKAGQALGLHVESVRGRGYRLTTPVELLDREQVLAELTLSTRSRIARLEILEAIDSTNSYLVREAQAGAPSGTLCLAERQTAGRGRRGRRWVSPFGTNVYLSLLWRYPFGPSEVAGLSLAAGTAVATALSAEGASDIALKWPNDVLWGRRKLGGLLLEVAGESGGPSTVVVGVGVNTRLEPAVTAALDQPWVDLTTALGNTDIRRNRIAGRITEQLILALEGYGRSGLSPFLTAWERFDCYAGERVEVAFGERKVLGIHAGVNERGALLLDTGHGIETFHAGEVSLRSPEA